MNSSPKKNTLFSFDGLQRPVSFSGCGEMIDELKIILGDWKFQEVSTATAAEPVISVRENEFGYHRKSPWLANAATYREPLDAACDFVVDLINGYVADNPGMLCLHCAAVEFSKGLVIFPATHQAGKSTLAVALAMGGRLDEAAKEIDLALSIQPDDDRTQAFSRHLAAMRSGG